MKVPGDQALDDQLLYADVRIAPDRPAPMKAASAPALPTLPAQNRARPQRRREMAHAVSRRSDDPTGQTARRHQLLLGSLLKRNPMILHELLENVDVNAAPDVKKRAVLNSTSMPIPQHLHVHVEVEV